MANEAPALPLNDGDMPHDHEQYDDGGNDPEKGNSKPDEAGQGDDKKPGQGAKKDEGSSAASDEQIKKLTEAWREDREYFQGEVKRLRSEAKSPKLTKAEEEELEGLDENERVDKLIEFREKRKKEADEAEVQAIRSEIRFYERTDKEFADNKQAILKVASDYDCPSLKQAILIWRGINAKNAKKDEEIHDKRKKNADGKGGGNAGGTTSGKPYDRKTESKKSFGDFYREKGL